MLADADVHAEIDEDDDHQSTESCNDNGVKAECTSGETAKPRNSEGKEPQTTSRTYEKVCSSLSNELSNDFALKVCLAS